MIVIVADYENAPKAVAPDLLLDMDDWYSYLFEAKPYGVDPAWIYIVPEGYTIERKVPICDVGTHHVCMDVLYPSGVTDPVPAVLQITSTKQTGEWVNQRAYYIYGLLTTGYAGAIMDWTAGGADVLFQEHVFPEKRAARLLRARAKDWNLSGTLGVTGHSKGSGRAAGAALINECEEETDLGRYPNQSSRFQVALLSAGQHDKEHIREDGFIKRPVEGTPVPVQRVCMTYLGGSIRRCHHPSGVHKLAGRGQGGNANEVGRNPSNAQWKKSRSHRHLQLVAVF